MISDTVFTAVKTQLETAGFCVMREYIGDINTRSAGSPAYTAFVRVGQVELSELTLVGNTSQCRAAVTLEIRLIGAAAGFFDAQTVMTMAENAAERIFFSSDMIVKRILCGEPKKNMSLGRLEQTLTVTAVTVLENNTGDEEEEE